MSALNFYHWFDAWFGRPPLQRAGRAQLHRIREAIRTGDVDQASTLLDECGEAGERDADCLNLRGVIAECRGDWPLARRSWVRAARTSKNCLAAKHNLARYYELFTWGRCRDAVALGDEPELQL